MVAAVIISFDTSGLREVRQGAWEDPRTGDGIVIQQQTGKLGEPAWLEDVPALRRNLARNYAGHACLIEADPVPIGGMWGVYQLSKQPIPNAPHGQVFTAQIMLAKEDVFTYAMYFAQERGTTGVREAVLGGQIGFENYFLPHPYDPQLTSKLPFHRADDPQYDAQFPDHPLSRARAWARWMSATAQVDPRFLAMPDFRASGGFNSSP